MSSAMQAFFANVAKARTVKTILRQCYGDKAAVSDELVEYVSTGRVCETVEFPALCQ